MASTKISSAWDFPFNTILLFDLNVCCAGAALYADVVVHGGLPCWSLPGPQAGRFSPQAEQVKKVIVKAVYPVPYTEIYLYFSSIRLMWIFLTFLYSKWNPWRSVQSRLKRILGYLKGYCLESVLHGGLGLNNCNILSKNSSFEM